MEIGKRRVAQSRKVGPVHLYTRVCSQVSTFAGSGRGEYVVDVGGERNDERCQREESVRSKCAKKRRLSVRKGCGKEG
jgi:hypothetical protein